MRHTNDEINRAADRFEELADKLDPATAQIDHVDDLRQIAAASETVRTDEARLRENVEVARAHGRSWNQRGPWACSPTSLRSAGAPPR